MALDKSSVECERNLNDRRSVREVGGKGGSSIELAERDSCRYWNGLRHRFACSSSLFFLGSPPPVAVCPPAIHPGEASGADNTSIIRSVDERRFPVDRAAGETRGPGHSSVLRV